MIKNNSVLVQNEEQESRQVRRDLVFVIIMNILFFGALIGLFFWNRSTGGVDSFFSHFLKF